VIGVERNKINVDGTCVGQLFQKLQRLVENSCDVDARRIVEDSANASRQLSNALPCVVVVENVLHHDI